MNAHRQSLVAKVGDAQREIVEAFLAKHKCQPDEAIVEIGRTPVQGSKTGDTRTTWRVRKMTDAEKKAAATAQVVRDQQALAKKPEPVVYIVTGGFFHVQAPTAVYLSELGAKSAAGSRRIAKVAVKA